MLTLAVKGMTDCCAQCNQFTPIGLHLGTPAVVSTRRRCRSDDDNPEVITVVNRPSHTLSVPHKMISESPACLDCPNGARGSFAGPLVKSDRKSTRLNSSH